MTTTCSTIGHGHQVNPDAVPIAIVAAAGWRQARILLADGNLLLIGVEGESRWFAQHNAGAVYQHAMLTDADARYHTGFDLLELGGQMYSVFPLAEDHTSTMLLPC